MCIVSMAMDNFHDRHKDLFPTEPLKHTPGEGPVIIPQITREEFDALKKEVEALKNLIPHLKQFDEETGQPDCEMAEKIALLKSVADALGVDMEGVV